MNNIGLTLTADNKAMIRAFQEVEKATGGMSGRVKSSFKDVERSAFDASAAIGQMKTGLLSLAGGVGLAQITKQFVQTADAMALLDARLKNAIGTGEDYARAQQDIYKIAQANNLSLQDTATLYTKLHEPVKRLGGSAKETTGIVEAFALSLRLGGANTQEAAAATLQFAQAMGSGKLQGDEFRSMAEASPRFMKALAEGMGVPIESLKEMGSEGKLTADIVGNALVKSLAVLKSESGNLPDTVGGAFQRVKNEATLAAVAMEQATGASGGFAEILGGVADQVKIITAAIAQFGAATKGMGSGIDFVGGAIKVVGTVFETVIVLGAEAAFMIRAVVKNITDLGGMAAAFQSGGLDGLAEARARMRKEDELARTEHDKFTASVTSATTKVLAQRDALKTNSLSAAENSNEMQRLINQHGQVGLATLKSAAIVKQSAADAKKAAKEAADARKAELAVGELRNKLVEENAKREAKNLIDMAKLHEASVKPFEQSLKAQEKRVESLEQEEAAIALSEKMNVSLAQAVEMVNIAKLKEQQIDAMGNEDAVAAIQKEIEEREKLVKLIGNKESRDASAKAAKQAADDWKKASDKIQDSITDALMRGFESGKGFAENLKATIKNMFSTLVLRPVINAIVGGVTGLGGSAASAGGLSGLLGGGSGALGTLDTIKNVYSTITGGFSALGDKVAFAAQDIGAWLVQNTTGTLNSVGGSLMGSAGTLGTIGSYAGGALAGVGIGNAISGQFSAFGNKNTATVGGTAIGALFGGPLGAAIGGAIGGVVNRAFGMGAKSVTGEGISGTFGASGSDVSSFQSWFQKGGWFRSDKSGVNRSPISTEMDQFLDSALGSIATSVKSYSDVLGLNTAKINGFTKSININFQGLDAAGREKAIANEIASFGDDMARQMLTTTEQVTYKWKFFGREFDYVVNQVIAPERWMREGETATAALTRMSTSLAAVNGALGLMNQTLLASSLSGGEAASKLVDLFGGIENFSRASDAYYQAFYSESERSTKVLGEIGKALGSAGLTAPTTLQGFRALVEAQDLNTDAGRNNYAVLMQLAPAFAQATNALAATTGAIVDTAAAAEAAAQAERERAEAVLQEHQELQARLDELTLTAAELQERERNALDASNRALFDQIKAVEAQQAAAEAAAQAERERAERLAAIAQERQGLQDRLDQLTMTSAQLLEKERNALDASNRALFDQIQAVEAQKAATEAATQAERERADAMAAAGRTVQDEIRRLRGLNGNTTNQAALQAQFATLTGMARAGDADALAKLPAISQAIEEASRLTAVSALDIARMRTWLSGSLSDTITALGLNVPAFADGGMHAGGIRLVGENGPELEVTGASRIYNAQQTAAMLQGGGDAASEMRAMREELAMLRAEARATAINTGRQADLMKRVTRNGEAMTVQTDLTPLEVTTS